MKPTLLIMAAGIGSRYGGLKQIDQVGPSGEAIIDYSIYDAIRAGFGKVIFIIRRDIENDFREVFEPKLNGRIDFDFVFQELDMVPAGLTVPGERVKPWGTAHAVWVAEKAVNEPFVVINADDFYGSGSYITISDYLMKKNGADDLSYCMMGFNIENTLSDFGTVSRAICNEDNQSFLTSIVERTEIERKGGRIYYKDEEGKDIPMTGKEPVSMNIWGFKPSIFRYIEKHFLDFIRDNLDNIKAELYIPTVINDIVNTGIGSVKILPATDHWFGITYREDKSFAIQHISKMIEDGIYPDNLWNL